MIVCFHQVRDTFVSIRFCSYVTEWGDELCDFVFRSSRMATTIFSFYDPRLGLKGEFLDVLISRKASAADLVTGSSGHQVGAKIS